MSILAMQMIKNFPLRLNLIRATASSKEPPVAPPINLVPPSSSSSSPEEIPGSSSEPPKKPENPVQEQKSATNGIKSENSAEKDQATQGVEGSPSWFLWSSKKAANELPAVETASFLSSIKPEITTASNEDPPKNSDKPIQEQKSCTTDQVKTERIPIEKDQATQAADVGGLPATIEPKVVEKQQSYLGYLGDAMNTMLGLSGNVVTGVASYLKKTPEKEKSPTLVIQKKLSRHEVVSQCQANVDLLLTGKEEEIIRKRMVDFSNFLMDYPQSRSYAVESNPELIKFLLKEVKKAEDKELRAEARKCLALVGHMMPLKYDGIRVLSLDGGGTRGMVTLEILDAIEKAAGTKICQLFDYIMGVSTGGIIAILLAAKQYSISEARQKYMDISQEVFDKKTKSYAEKGGFIIGQYSYNSEKWAEILQRELGKDDMLIETARFEGTPKLGVLSCIVNVRNLQSYVFRNYDHPPGKTSHYRGGTNFHIWQVLHASTAAPVYFKKVQLGSIEHQDGGVLANNPTGIAIHEAKVLWPKEKVQCVVSIGNGRTIEQPELIPIDSKNSWGASIEEAKAQLFRIIDSATDTEKVHLHMSDHLDPSVYFRFNPYTSHAYGLDETDPLKLNEMVEDTKQYVRKNRKKVDTAVDQLLKPPSMYKKVMREFENWKHEYQGYAE